MRNVRVKHDRVYTPVGRHSLVRPEFQDECDVNRLMARYEKVGQLPGSSPEVPRYLDLSDVPDFQSAMNLMIEADRAFMSLPARVRREFDHDPAKFVEYAGDPDNLSRMREWGLAPPEKAPDGPINVRVIPEEAPAKPEDKRPM